MHCFTPVVTTLTLAIVLGTMAGCGTEDDLTPGHDSDDAGLVEVPAQHLLPDTQPDDHAGATCHAQTHVDKGADHPDKDGGHTQDRGGHASEKIWGGTDYDRCTASQEADLDQAMNALEDSIRGSAEYLDCLLDHYASWDNGLMREYVYDLSNTTADVEIACVDLDAGVAGEAILCTDDEELEIDNGYLASSTPLQVGGVIVHEVLHSNCFSHPKKTGSLDYDLSVPQLARECAQTDRDARLSRRSTLSGKVTLPHAGYVWPGGAWQRVECPDDTAAVGLVGQSNGAAITQLGLRCGAVAARTHGPATATTARLGTATATGTGFQGDCPTTMLPAALTGTALLSVASLWGECADIGLLRTGFNIPVPALGPWGDLNTGRFFARTCSAGRVLTGLEGHVAGGTLDALRPVCRPFDEVGYRARIVTTRGTTVGTTATGTQVQLLCPGNTVGRGISGQHVPYVNSLQLICAEHNRAAPNTITGRRAATGVAGGRGEDDGILADQEECPGSNDVLVGIKGRSGALVDQVQGVCADLREWRSAASTVTTRQTVALGGTGGGAYTRTCPRGEALVGVLARSRGTTVDQLQIQCSNLAQSYLGDTSGQIY